MKYFRITGYHPQADVCFIADCHGKFEKLWQFSTYLADRGIKIIKLGNSDTFEVGNIPLAGPDSANIILRACAKGKPTINGDIVEVNGKSYKA